MSSKAGAALRRCAGLITPAIERELRGTSTVTAVRAKRVSGEVRREVPEQPHGEGRSTRSRLQGPSHTQPTIPSLPLGTST
jgi:hypothetical protein